MEVKEAADLLDNLIGMVEDNHGADYDTALKMGIEALSTSGDGPEPVDDTISRQAAIDALGDEPEVWTGKDEYAQGLNNQWHYDRNAIKALPSTQPEPHWIPCSERLPEDENRSYWVCTDNGYQHECRWTNINPVWTNLTTDWHWNIFDIPQYSKVIAWMPLPEPYKGES